MAALVDGQYALSSHFSTSADKTVVHVKLTDAAFKALEEFQKIKDATSRRTKLVFKDNHGIIKVPVKKSSDNPDGIRQFQLSLSALQTDPNGSFECIWQQQRKLVTLGSMSHKISVHATDDVYQTTREKMNKAEVESKKFCAKEIKPSGPHISRKIKRVVKGEGGSSSARNNSLPNKTMAPGNLPQNGAIQNKQPINAQHNAHTFPTHKSTTSSSHQRTGHSPLSVSSHNNSGSRQSPHRPPGAANPAPSRQSPHPPPIIGRSSPNPAVYNLPYRDRIIHLLALRPYKKLELVGRLQKDGIKDRDKNALSGVLQQVAVFSTKDNSYTLVKHLYNDVRSDFPGYTETDRQLLKRRMPQAGGDGTSQSTATSPAISPAHSHSSTGSSPGGSQKRPTSTTEEETLQPLMKKPRISHERQREMKLDASRQIKNEETHNQISPLSLKTLSPSDGSPAEVSTTTPDTALQPKAYLKTQNNNNNREKPRRNSTTKVPASSTSDMPDYLIHYQVIQFADQRQKYKLDFNAEYEEYLTKHGYIDKVTKRFKEFEKSLRKQEEGSEDYENVKKQILSEYRVVRKDPNYIEYRRRIDYLHKKLGHIKKLILDYDQSHLMTS